MPNGEKLDALMAGLHASVERYVKTAFDALAARVEALEAHKGLSYRGTWRQEVEYGRDDLVTHAGQMWLCRLQGTRAKPGGNDAWQLASKTDLKPK